MKSDLQRLMAARDLAAVVVVSDHNFSAPRHYLINGAHISRGWVILARDAEPIIIANGMEVEEAAKSGHRVYSDSELGWGELLKQAEGDRARTEVAFWARILETAGVASGRIGVYGVGEHHTMIALIELLRHAHPQYAFVGELGMTLFDEAALTKSPDEIAVMRDIGERTSRVLQAAWDLIAAQRVENNQLVKADGSPFTIGDVRRFVRRTLLDHDLEDTGMIFAQGRDAGFPHSHGEDPQPLMLGQSIVFDLFPRQIGGGYFHDVTRTWSLGYATPEVQQTYDQVLEAFELATEVLRANMPAREVQEAVLDYFEQRGHKTSRTDSAALEGYVHSLGHGVGLKIHERPNLHHLSKDTLQVGSIVTIEPGLYYPERGYGVRVEDTMLIGEDGTLESLTPFRKDLILPVG